MSLHSLMFGWEYPPLHLGGLGVACQGLVQGLLKNNVRVTLVLPHPNPEDTPNLSIRSATDSVLQTVRVQSLLTPYETIEGYDVRIASIPRETQQIYGEDMASAIAAYTATSVELTRDIHPDVIHCHDWMTYQAGARAAKHHRKPLVAHIHATELDRTHFSPNEWIYGYERRGFLAADRIIAVSQYTKDILVKHYGIGSDKISVVHNGSAPVAAHPTPLVQHGTHRPLVLFLGRLVLQKGPRQFLEMARIVHCHRPDAQFIMAGDGHMLPELMDEACRLGLSDCVAFAGKVSTREANTLYSQADCFVMPSLSEPFGLVALEAVAHGTPVILSRQSGAAEVLDHAFKIDFWDTDKMADCVLTVLREQPLADQLKAEAPRVLQRLTWANQAKAVTSLYRNLITNR